MRVRMNQLAAGPNGSMEPGTEHDVSDRQAVDLLRGRYADPVGAIPKHIQAQLRSGTPATPEAGREKASATAPERRGGQAATGADGTDSKDSKGTSGGNAA